VHRAFVEQREDRDSHGSASGAVSSSAWSSTSPFASSCASFVFCEVVVAVVVVHVLVPSSPPAASAPVRGVSAVNGGGVFVAVVQ